MSIPLTFSVTDLILIFGDMIKLIIKIVDNAGAKDERKREQGEVLLREAEKAMANRDYYKLHRLIRRVREL